MHDHARHTLATLPTPERGSLSRFWVGDDQYTLQPDGDRWYLYFMRPRVNRATPLITLELQADGRWFGMAVNGFEKYEGATHVDVIRQVI